MQFFTIPYRGHQVCVPKSGDHWQAWDSTSGKRSALYSSSEAAVEEVRCIIDADYLTRRW